MDIDQQLVAALLRVASCGGLREDVRERSNSISNRESFDTMFSNT
jgi:hypothetical protein